MNFELQGKLILKEDTVQISQAFKKREFVIEAPNEKNSDWNDFVKFQITQDRCSLLDEFNLGDELKVSFNIRGRKWEKNGNVNYITNLEAWRIGRISNQSGNKEDTGLPEMDDADFPTDAPEDDLPF